MSETIGNGNSEWVFDDLKESLFLRYSNGIAIMLEKVLILVRAGGIARW
jgi:hypothetical protein